jgi:hypothetical protein
MEEVMKSVFSMIEGVMVIVCLLAGLTLVPGEASAATTYNFSSLGREIGEFKPQGNRFLVSDLFENEDPPNETAMYYNVGDPTVTGITIKVDSTHLASFDLLDMGFHVYLDEGDQNISSIKITATRSIGGPVSVTVNPGIRSPGNSFSLGELLADLSSFTNVTQLQFDITMDSVWNLDFSSITVANENSNPVVAVNTGLTLNQSASVTTVTNNMLRVEDAEQAATALTFTIGAAPSKGVLKKSDVVLAASSTFTQDDIDNSRITYTPSGLQNGTDGFTFIVGDGIGGSIAATPFPITIIDNIAPTAVISYDPAGPYKKGDLVTISATFSEAVADSPAVKIAISALTGGNSIAETDMTKITATHYTYSYAVGSGNGTGAVTLPSGQDLAGNPITAVPMGGATFTVNKSASSVSLSGSTSPSLYGAPITFTATVVSGSSGTMDFKDGAESIPGCSAVDISGSTATCITTLLVEGSHSVTAEYGGDSTYNPSASQAVTHMVNAPPTLTVTIDGDGSVHGSSLQGQTYSCSSSVCPAIAFAYGDRINLTATGSNSTFSSWSGDCSGVNQCTIILDIDKSVGVSFVADPPLLRIEGDQTSYYAIGSTLSIPVVTAVVRAKKTIFSETIVAANNNNLTLRGGFTDADFTDVGQTDYSTISGWLKIQVGKLTVERVKIQP